MARSHWLRRATDGSRETIAEFSAGARGRPRSLLTGLRLPCVLVYQCASNARGNLTGSIQLIRGLSHLRNQDRMQMIMSSGPGGGAFPVSKCRSKKSRHGRLLSVIRRTRFASSVSACDIFGDTLPAAVDMFNSRTGIACPASLRVIQGSTNRRVDIFNAFYVRGGRTFFQPLHGHNNGRNLKEIDDAVCHLLPGQSR